MTLLALFGPIFVVLPSPASSYIDYVTVLLPPMVICWNWPLPVVVEGEERRKPWNQLELVNQHGSCDLLRVGLNDLTNIKFSMSFEPVLNRSHDYVLFALVVSILCILYKNKR